MDGKQDWKRVILFDALGRIIAFVFGVIAVVIIGGLGTKISEILLIDVQIKNIYLVLLSIILIAALFVILGPLVERIKTGRINTRDEMIKKLVNILVHVEVGYGEVEKTTAREIKYNIVELINNLMIDPKTKDKEASMLDTIREDIKITSLNDCRMKAKDWQNSILQMER